MRCAALVYHKNITKIYPAAWIEKFRASILGQTEKNFDIIEINYGGTHERIFEDGIFFSDNYPNFVYALNFGLLFCQSNKYDCVFNTNCDDYYAKDRFERQLIYIKRGFDIVSSNFTLVQDDKETHSHRFHELNIANELRRNHNIIGHPAVAYSANFIKNNRYNPDEIPLEDLKLWKRTVDRYKFAILPDHLLFHRLHSNSVCQNQNSR